MALVFAGVFAGVFAFAFAFAFAFIMFWRKLFIMARYEYRQCFI